MTVTLTLTNQLIIQIFKCLSTLKLYTINMYRIQILAQEEDKITDFGKVVRDTFDCKQLDKDYGEFI